MISQNRSWSTFTYTGIYVGTVQPFANIQVILSTREYLRYICVVKHPKDDPGEGVGSFLIVWGWYNLGKSVLQSLT